MYASVNLSPDDGQDGLPPRIGNYRVEEHLGAGGMGAVYRALRRGAAAAPGDQAAAGQLSPIPTAALRFRREARMAARLNHPSIVHIYDIVETADGDWIVMELVEGKTLDRLLREGRLALVQHRPPGPRDRRRPGRSPCAGHRASRPEGVQRDGHRRRARQDPRLRAGQDVSRREPKQDISAPGRRGRHLPRDVARAGAGTDGRSPLRPVLARDRCSTRCSPASRRSTPRRPPETLARICALRAAADPRHRSGSVPRELADLTHRLLQKVAGAAAAEQPEVAAAARAASSAQARRPLLRRRRRDGAGTPSRHARPGRPDRRAARAQAQPAAARRSSERRQMTVSAASWPTPCSPDAEPSQAFDPETLYELMLQLRPLAQTVAQRHDGSARQRRSAIGCSSTSAIRRRTKTTPGERCAPRSIWSPRRAYISAAVPAAGTCRPALRVGIHTGPAVVSTSPNSPEPVVLGATLDVALRLQASAEPGHGGDQRGHALARPSRHSPPRRSPRCRRRPELASALVPYRVARRQRRRARRSRSTSRPWSAAIANWTQLMNRWEQARAGTGQAVLLERRARHRQVAVAARAARAGQRRSRRRRGAVARGPWLALHAEHAAARCRAICCSGRSASEPGRARRCEQLDAAARPSR